MTMQNFLEPEPEQPGGYWIVPPDPNGAPDTPGPIKVAPATVLLDSAKLDMPPTSNSYWRHTVGYTKEQGKPYVKTYLTDQAEAYLKRVGWQAKAALVDPNLLPLPDRALLRERFTLYFSTERDRLYSLDCTNHIKLLEDAVMRALGLDDRFVAGFDGVDKLPLPESEQAEYVLYTLYWTGEVAQVLAQGSKKVLRKPSNKKKADS